MANSKVFFGIVLEVNDEPIALEPTTAISDIKTKGIDVGLPADKRVDLGRLGYSLRGVMESVGVDSATLNSFFTAEGTVNEDALPAIGVLREAVQYLLNANLAVEEFHVKLPPTEKPPGGTAIIEGDREDTAFTLGLSATWQDDAGTLVGDLKLRGMYFKVSNEEI